MIFHADKDKYTNIFSGTGNDASLGWATCGFFFNSSNARKFIITKTRKMQDIPQLSLLNKYGFFFYPCNKQHI